jgi:hypothetical protein
MTGRRALLWCGLIVAAAACGSGGQTGRTTDTVEGVDHRVAVDEDALQPPGTELVSGIEVQPGSALVATTFPIVDLYLTPPSSTEPVGWQALVVVDGDPIEVWESYVVALGMPQNAGSRGACIVRPPVPAPVQGVSQPLQQRLVTESRIEAEDHLECHATIGSTSMEMVVGSQQCLQYEHPECEPKGAAHLFISVRDTPIDPTSESLGTDELRYERSFEADPSQEQHVVRIPIPTGPVVTPALDGDVATSLPEAGERVDDGLDYFLDRTRAGLVPKGARSLVAPAMLIPCNSGMVAIIQVAGTPRNAVDLFDRADGTDVDDPIASVLEGVDDQNRAWAGGEITTAGGYYLDILALDAGDDTSTVLLTECGD